MLLSILPGGLNRSLSEGETFVALLGNLVAPPSGGETFWAFGLYCAVPLGQNFFVGLRAIVFRTPIGDLYKMCPRVVPVGQSIQ